MEDELVPDSCFQGHEFTVWSLAFTPDSRYVISGGQDATIRVWDLHSGSLVHILIGHRGAVYGLSVMADGVRIVSVADRDLAVRIWDMEEGAPISALAPNSAHVNAVASSPDNRYVVTGGDDGKARIWDIDSGILLRVLDHARSIYSIAISPDGRHLVIGSKTTAGIEEKGLIWVWDFELGILLHTLEGHKGHVTSLAMTADSRYILSGGQDGTVRLWDLETGTLLYIMAGHGGPVLNVTVTPDGRHIISGSSDNTLRLWQLHGGVFIHSIEHTENVHAVAVSANGRHVATGDVEGNVQVWDFRVGTSWIDDSADRAEAKKAELEAFREVQLRKVINRYETLPLDRLKTLLRFETMPELEDWLLELPLDTPVKIDGDLLIIRKQAQ
ncbi:MAG: WD40 repeat domain-containing protein [Candidatus Thorarchaeota archaeon]